jgi:toxin-antitoxin system PIN domain toxin
MMLLADSNIWLALALSRHEFHAVARAWLEEKKAPDKVLFCRSTQQSFVRLLTTSAVLAPYGIPPLTNKAAWSVYQGFLADERISWVEEPRGLESSWKKLAARPRAAPKLWMDAYLAAFALAGGYQLVTTDAAFRQFKGLDLLVLSKTT